MTVSEKPLPSSYGDAFADIYDEWYGSLTDDDFIAALSRRLPPHPARVLELGVGTGRLIHKLIAHRAPVVDELVGTDASEKMLAIAESNGLHHLVTLECSDFSQQLPAGQFDAVFVGYNTLFNLPDDESLTSCLSLVTHSLTPHGFFMCDLVIPRGDSNEEFSEERIMANGDRVTSSSRHNPALRTISGAFTHTTNDGQSVVRPWNVHYVTPQQLDELAHDAGMRLVERTANGHGQPFSNDSSRHISTYILR